MWCVPDLEEKKDGETTYTEIHTYLHTQVRLDEIDFTIKLFLWVQPLSCVVVWGPQRWGCEDEVLDGDILESAVAQSKNHHNVSQVYTYIAHSSGGMAG